MHVCVCVRFPYIIAVLSTTNRDISCHYSGDDQRDNYDDDNDDHEDIYTCCRHLLTTQTSGLLMGNHGSHHLNLFTFWWDLSRQEQPSSVPVGNDFRQEPTTTLKSLKLKHFLKLPFLPLHAPNSSGPSHVRDFIVRGEDDLRIVSSQTIWKHLAQNKSAQIHIQSTIQTFKAKNVISQSSTENTMKAKR